MVVFWFVLGAVVGLVAGWLLRTLRGPRTSDLRELEERVKQADRRLQAVTTDREEQRNDLQMLRAALRSERALLDGVASKSDVDPETFRRVVSREYLGRELNGSSSKAMAVVSDFGDEREAGLRAELALKDAQLDEARSQIRRIRSDVERLADARSAETTIDLRGDEAVLEVHQVDPDVTALRARADSARALEDEVAALRARLADTSVAHDDLRTRLAARRALDSRIEALVEELARLQRAAAAESD
jgi:hypothetical protein